MKKLTRSNVTPQVDYGAPRRRLLSGRQKPRHTGRSLQAIIAEEAVLSGAEKARRAKREKLLYFASNPIRLAEVRKAERLLDRWLCEHPDDEEMRGLYPMLSRLRGVYEAQAVHWDWGGKRELAEHGLPATRENLLQFNAGCCAVLLFPPITLIPYALAVPTMVHRLGDDLDFSGTAQKLMVLFFVLLFGSLGLLWWTCRRKYPAFATGIGLMLPLFELIAKACGS